MKQFALVLTLLAASFAQPAMAADNGYYFGAGIADGLLVGCTYDVFGNCNNTYNSNSHPATNLRLIGGYDFNKFIGIEAELADLGTYDIMDPLALTKIGTVKATAVTLAAKGGYKFRFGLSVFGKVGLAAVKTKYSLLPGWVTANTSRNSTGLVLGLGVQYDFNDAIGVRLYDEPVAFDDKAISAAAGGLGALAIFKF